MKESRYVLITMGLKYDDDIVLARQRARQIAKLLGFSNLIQVQISTAVSEIARNVILYANFGKIEFYIDKDKSVDRLMIKVSDRGPGISDVNKILKNGFESENGMGIGIRGSKLLMDYFFIESKPGEGTTVIMGKRLPNTKRLNKDDLTHIEIKLKKLGPISAYDEIKEQNRELIELLDNLTQQKKELEKLNRELIDKNRGIQSLYDELQDKVNELKKSIELKNKFIYYITHEFKTPVSSIIYLANILIEESDGGLTQEQKKQIVYIRKAAKNLINLVNEMLELAKHERGNLKVEPIRFHVSELFSSLRGIFNVLNTNEDVELTFKYQDDMPPIYSDINKISQILKNLIVNALKFTKKGKIFVEASVDKDNKKVVFKVTDTGVGIPKEMQSSIFRDYEKIGESDFNGIKGTGLGLSISKKFAELLGGSLVLKKSEPGKGSTFVLWIPMDYN